MISSPELPYTVTVVESSAAKGDDACTVVLQVSSSKGKALREVKVNGQVAEGGRATVTITPPEEVEVDVVTSEGRHYASPHTINFEKE